MRRTLGLLLFLLEGVLGLVAIGALAIWVRSTYAYDHLARQRWEMTSTRSWRTDLEFISESGWLSVKYHYSGTILLKQPNDPKSDILSSPTWDSYSAEAGAIDWSRLPKNLKGWRGLWWQREISTSRGFIEDHCHFLIHYGLITSVAGAWPALRLLRFLWGCIGIRDRIRRQNHQCVGCGYDLRATPDRCPECGLIPQPLRM